MNDLPKVLRGMADMLDGPQNAGNLAVPAIIGRFRDAADTIESLEAENAALREQLDKVKKQAGLWKRRFKLEERANEISIEKLLNVTAERNVAIKRTKQLCYLEYYGHCETDSKLCDGCKNEWRGREPEQEE